MFEIKRINKLWSNESLQCKKQISIPLFNESRSAVVTPTQLVDSKHSLDQQQKAHMDPLNEHDTGESVKDFFKRIDSNVKQTKKAVRKLNKKS
jgi:hypothetical protein